MEKEPQSEKKRHFEVSDIITDNFLSGNLSKADLEDLKTAAGPEEDDGSYQWRVR